MICLSCGKSNLFKYTYLQLIYQSPYYKIGPVVCATAEYCDRTCDRTLRTSPKANSACTVLWLMREMRESWTERVADKTSLNLLTLFEVKQHHPLVVAV